MEQFKYYRSICGLFLLLMFSKFTFAKEANVSCKQLTVTDINSVNRAIQSNKNAKVGDVVASATIYISGNDCHEGKGIKILANMDHSGFLYRKNEKWHEYFPVIGMSNVGVRFSIITQIDVSGKSFASSSNEKKVLTEFSILENNTTFLYRWLLNLLKQMMSQLASMECLGSFKRI